MSVTHNNEEYIQYSAPEFKHDLLGSFEGLGPLIYDVSYKHADRIAQIEASTGKSESFGELNKRSVQLALELKYFGVRPGNIISICSVNSMDVCVPLIAGLYVGATISFLHPQISVQTTTHLLSLVKPKVIFCTLDSVKLLEQSLVSNNYNAPMVILDDENSSAHILFSKFFLHFRNQTNFQPYAPSNTMDTAIIMYSSGTTGLAKGICLSHYGILYSALPIQNSVGNVQTVLNFSPFYWITSIINFTVSYVLNATRIIVPNFDAEIALEILDKYKVNVFNIPTMCIQLLKKQKFRKYDLKELKFVFVGGNTSTAQNILDARQIFPHSTVLNSYGMTELNGIVMYFHDVDKNRIFLENKPESVGTPTPGILCKVVDLGTENNLGPNKLGEIRIKSRSVMNGYHNMNSSEAWDSQGWFCSGDIGYYDEDGCFYIKDRIKDLLKFRLWQVTPSAIESVLMQHPKVREAVVIGIPHELDGDHSMGIVVLNDENERNGMETELIQFVADRMGFWDRLHGGLKIVQSIPRTLTGKSRRRDIKILVLDGQL